MDTRDPCREDQLYGRGEVAPAVRPAEITIGDGTAEATGDEETLARDRIDTSAIGQDYEEKEIAEPEPAAPATLAPAEATPLPEALGQDGQAPDGVALLKQRLAEVEPGRAQKIIMGVIAEEQPDNGPPVVSQLVIPNAKTVNVRGWLQFAENDARFQASTRLADHPLYPDADNWSEAQRYLDEAESYREVRETIQAQAAAAEPEDFVVIKDHAARVAYEGAMAGIRRLSHHLGNVAAPLSGFAIARYQEAALRNIENITVPHEPADTLESNAPTPERPQDVVKIHFVHTQHAAHNAEVIADSLRKAGCTAAAFELAGGTAEQRDTLQRHMNTLLDPSATTDAKNAASFNIHNMNAGYIAATLHQLQDSTVQRATLIDISGEHPEYAAADQTSVMGQRLKNEIDHSAPNAMLRATMREYVQETARSITIRDPQMAQHVEAFASELATEARAAMAEEAKSARTEILGVVAGWAHDGVHTRLAAAGFICTDETALPPNPAFRAVTLPVKIAHRIAHQPAYYPTPTEIDRAILEQSSRSIGLNADDALDLATVLSNGQVSELMETLDQIKQASGGIVAIHRTLRETLGIVRARQEELATRSRIYEDVEEWTNRGWS